MEQHTVLAPRRISPHDRNRRQYAWETFCVAGIVELLAQNKHVQWLSHHPNERYGILISAQHPARFAPDGASGPFDPHSIADLCRQYWPFEGIRTQPGDALWTELSRIARDYIIEVTPMNFGNVYHRWNGNIYSLQTFCAISIRTKRNP
jgi:hypothetical protein